MNSVILSPSTLLEYQHNAWQGATDGTPWMQRTLIRLVKVLPLWLMYGVMALAIPFYVLFDVGGRRASYRFFRKRIGYGPLRSALHVFKNMYNMGKVVIDRFAAYAGMRFTMECNNLNVLHDKEGAFLTLSSHVGNYEMAGYMLRTPKPMKVLVYAGETATVMQNRGRLFGNGNITMVPVMPDLSHLFTLNAALSEGEIASLPADRSFGSRKTFRLPFLGADASFPAGPFTLAVQREVPAVAIFGVKTGRKKYRVILEDLPLPQGSTPQEKARSLAVSYVESLERVVREVPDQWYNFFDFWK